MADITISDLELAPALADDMVLPVENTTDTYAATLAMLRRLINKTFVEVENADFNALTDDGFYQCTGTPTNSPVAGAINWTLQVSTESGVVVQRAFSLDDNFANLYIRRWNGVTWTGWLEVGAGALTNKANIDLSNLNNEGNVAASNLNSKGIRTVIETYQNGLFWYRVWSDGWIEQGGRENIDASFSQVINFIKPYEGIPQIMVTLNGNITNGTTTINSGVAQLAGSATNVNGNGFTLIKTSNTYANGSYVWKAQGI